MRLINADDLVKIFRREGNSDAWGGEFIRRTIEEQPAIETVPLEDYRSMEQTVYKLTQALAEAEPTKHYNTESYKMTVTDFPPVEYAPIKHGRWLPSDKGDCTYTCSECGFVRDAYILEEKAYCPRCGADMREVEE